jgi:hypothetical protein
MKNEISFPGSPALWAGSFTFYETIILTEVKRPQTQCLSPKGEFWVCSETNCRMVRNSFQRAKGGLGNSMVKNELYNESIPFLCGILYIF